MSQIRMSFLPPEYFQDFQELVLSISKIEWPAAQCSLLGREGQDQDGIDVLVRPSSGGTFGVQAKKRRLFGAGGKAELGGRLSMSQIEEMVTLAEKYDPPLEELIIATTALTDAPLQKSVAELNTKRGAVAQFTVRIWFWEDFQRHLNWNTDLQKLYYGEWVQKALGYTQEKHYLMMLRCAFSRPAFTTPLEMEDSGDDMATALSDTQQAINTGVLKDRAGETIQRAPMALGNVNGIAREHLEAASDALNRARLSYRAGVQAGTLSDTRRGVYVQPSSRGRSDARQVDSARADALDHVNAALATGEIEELKNYLRPDILR